MPSHNKIQTNHWFLHRKYALALPVWCVLYVISSFLFYTREALYVVKQKNRKGLSTTCTHLNPWSFVLVEHDILLHKTNAIL